MLLRELSLGDGDEAGQPRFRREQVVEARVGAVVGDVVTDRQQVTIAVVEEVVLQIAQLATTDRKLPELGQPRRSALRSEAEGVTQLVQPGAAIRGRGRQTHLRDQRAVNRGPERLLEARRVGQSGYLIQT